MMEKEFEIKGILNAINSISKIEKKKTKTAKRKDSTNKDHVLIKAYDRLNFNEEK